MLPHPGFEIPDAFLQPDVRRAEFNDHRPKLNNQSLQGGDHGSHHSTKRGRNTIQHLIPVNGYCGNRVRLPAPVLRGAHPSGQPGRVQGFADPRRDWGEITPRVPDGTFSSQPEQSPEFVNRFWTSLQVILDTARPVGRQLDEEDGRRLAQHCPVLAKFEAFFRSGIVDQMFENTRFSKVEHLLALVPGGVADDLRRLARGFHDHGLPHFGPDERFILNPTFAGT